MQCVVQFGIQDSLGVTPLLIDFTHFYGASGQDYWKSTTSCVFILGSIFFIWACKNQSELIIYSTKVEYYVVSFASK